MKDETGHVLIEGARWHWPVMGNPTQCGVPGCTRVLGNINQEDEDEQE